MFLAALAIATTLSSPYVVTTDWLEHHLGSPTVVVVEVGDKRDYDAAHVPGAHFIARADVVEDCEGIPNELPPIERLVQTFTSAGVGDSKRIVIYSRTPLVAVRAWFTLDYLGHGSRASILDGGWEKWSAESRPSTQIATVVQPQPFTVFERPYSVVKIAEMKDLVRRRAKLEAQFVTIDARPFTTYRAGHIPGAVSIPWTANLATEHPPVLRSEEELRQMYLAAGVTRDAIGITYCRTGMEAAMTYLVLRSLGYDITLYDGSMVEWDRALDTAIVREP